MFKKPAKIPRELFDVYRLELERYTSNIDFAVGVIDFASWDDSYCIMYKSLEVSCRDFAHAPFSYKNHIKKLNDSSNSKKILNEYRAKLGINIEEEKEKVKFLIEGNASQETEIQRSPRRSMRGRDKEFENLPDNLSDEEHEEGSNQGRRKSARKNRDYESCEDIMDEKCRKSPRIKNE